MIVQQVGCSSSGCSTALCSVRIAAEQCEVYWLRYGVGQCFATVQFILCCMLLLCFFFGNTCTVVLSTVCVVTFARLFCFVDRRVGRPQTPGPNPDPP